MTQRINLRANDAFESLQNKLQVDTFLGFVELEGETAVYR